MVARMWHGRVRRADAERYHRYLRDTGLSDYRRTPGNLGVYLLRRDEGDITHYHTLTFWDSIEAIARFAGDDYEAARYYPEDDQFLLEREPRVVHYQMMSTDSPGIES
jgi:heme-degrading monooxygenase HmoA